MFVVDASIWAARFLPSDANHSTSVAWLNAQASRQDFFVSPSILLPEVGGAIARRLNSEIDGFRAIFALRRYPHIRLVPVDHELARVSAALAAQLRLKGPDAVYAAVALRLGIPLVSLDREQRERAGQRVRAIEPHVT